MLRRALGRAASPKHATAASRVGPRRSGLRLLLPLVLLLAVPRSTCAATSVPADSIGVPCDSLPEFKTDPHETGSQGNQISGVVRTMLQDRRGHLWFGTQNGPIRYDGTTLICYRIRDARGHGVTVTAIAEDRAGHLWFGTDGGLTRYDGERFTRFTTSDGLPSDQVWGVFVDRSGVLWISTIAGMCRMEGDAFSPFPLPEATRRNNERGVSSPWLAWLMTQDRSGNRWFATEGSVYRYDGDSLTSISVMDSQSPTHVTSILEDRRGHFWFATQNKGLIHFDGEKFTNMTEQFELGGTEVGGLHEDRQGNIWFVVEHSGAYRYDGVSFTNYYAKQGLTSHALHFVYEDKAGRIWSGGWLGAFRLDGERFVNVTRKGPW